MSFRSDDSVSMDVESGSIASINTLPEEVLQECIAYLATPHDIAACALATKKTPVSLITGVVNRLDLR